MRIDSATLNDGRVLSMDERSRRREIRADPDHVHYWIAWTSCGFGGGLPSSGIMCFFCHITRPEPQP